MDNIIAIRKEDINKANEAFALLMSKTETRLNEEASLNPSKFREINANSLEKISVDFIKQSCSDTPFNPQNVILVSGQKFPDILADKYYGVEVKSTKQNHWVSTGSSIVESTRDEYVENIYMLFGKLGGNPPEFKCRPYQDVLYDIAVTHSPRYLINMDLKKGDSIFEKMNTSYDRLRTSSDIIEQVRRFYRNKAENEGKKEMPWWLTSFESDKPHGFNLRLWSTVDSNEKKELRALSMILFPETLTPQISRDKYSNLSLWLCSYRQIICPNIRDEFSAGGQIKYVNGSRIQIPIPKIFANIVKYSEIVRELLNNPTIDLIELIKEFNPTILNGTSLYNNWLIMCQQIADSYLKEIPLIEWIENNAQFSFTE